jgi:hypothetical protein
VAADLQLAIIVNRVLMPREIVRPGEDGVAGLARARIEFGRIGRVQLASCAETWVLILTRKAPGSGCGWLRPKGAAGVEAPLVGVSSQLPYYPRIGTIGYE